MSFAWLFRRHRPPAFSADLEGDQAHRLRTELLACVSPETGPRDARGRAQALVDLYGMLSERGRERFLQAVAGLDDGTPAERTAARYASFELAEYQGTKAGKNAVIEAVSSPRERMIALLAGIPGSAPLLAALRENETPAPTDPPGPAGTP